jgi:uncharacterized membrane protein YhhN
MRFFAPITLFYFSVLAVEIYAEIMDDLEMIWITKPLLMPLLLVLFLMNWEKNKPKEKWFFAAALVFSLFGDVFLMFRRDDLFVFGLASFLLGHLAYILSFSERIREANVSLMNKLLSAIPFLLFVISFLWFLQPHISGNEETAPLFPPVVVYASVISLMGYTALLRKNAVSVRSFWMVFGGALLFVLSDSCIAWNKFVTPLPQPGLIIMATYGLAQYLMTYGTLKSNRT